MGLKESKCFGRMENERYIECENLPKEGEEFCDACKNLILIQAKSSWEVALQRRKEQRQKAAQSAKEDDKNPLIIARKRKVQELREMGINPYSNNWKPTHTTQEMWDKFAHLIPKKD